MAGMMSQTRIVLYSIHISSYPHEMQAGFRKCADRIILMILPGKVNPVPEIRRCRGKGDLSGLYILPHFLSCF